MEKIFILGLPRTGTTSVCYAALQLGFKTAHTAYTKQAIADAEVIADTPIFADTAKLLALYPSAKFVYLEREKSLWVPSIQQLLLRMFKNTVRVDGGFNTHIKRCFMEVFAPFNEANINNDAFLYECYAKHKALVLSLFKNKPEQLIAIDVSKPEALQRFSEFVGKNNIQGEFEVINKGGKVTAWNDIKHPLKISSTRNGRIDKDLY